MSASGPERFENVKKKRVKIHSRRNGTKERNGRNRPAYSCQLGLSGNGQHRNTTTKNITHTSMAYVHAPQHCALCLPGTPCPCFSMVVSLKDSGGSPDGHQGWRSSTARALSRVCRRRWRTFHLATGSPTPPMRINCASGRMFCRAIFFVLQQQSTSSTRCRSFLLDGGLSCW